MVLAHKQIHRLMEQNREPRNKPTLTWSIYDKGGKNMKWKNSVGEKGQLRAKETGLLSHTIDKNKLKMN